MWLNLDQLLDQLNRAPSEGEIQRRLLPAEPPAWADIPADLHPALAAALRARGIGRLYSHQSEALAAVREGANVVVVTPTASGKSLCYHLPVLDALLRDPASRALYLFPTKALAQDQRAHLVDWLAALGDPGTAYTYDGDTPPDARQAIRQAGHLVLTNPDMLHAAMLPHHTRWARLWGNLRFVVVDEVHTYRGVFGSHVANVIRRLLRVCRFHGSAPRFICTSATIANPGELAERLLGTPVRVVDRSGAPRGARHFLVYNPPVVNRALGIRRSAQEAAARWSARFLRNGIPTIAFTRSRLGVELLLTDLRRLAGPQARRVAGYRGGYLPRERRAVERGLRDGSVLGVVSTNALELGVDIGSLQACVLHGYPGSVASTWQQAGRAGRGDGPAAVVLVATSDPLDQYIAAHPDYVLGQAPEAAHIQPDNLFVWMSHLKCAAFELPFADGESFGPGPLDDALAFLEEEGVLHHAGRRWHWMADHFPAADVSLRSATQENVVIVDHTEGAQVLGEVDWASAPLLVHDHAIYMHAGRQYLVDHLDFERRRATVHRVDVDYYTDAHLAVELKVLDVAAEAAAHAWGDVLVTAKATLFKKIRLATRESVGWGRIHLPELQLQTPAYWCAFPPEACAGLAAEQLESALAGVGHALASLAPLLLLCDRRDIHAVPQVRGTLTGWPTVYLYETVPGGVGLAERLFAAHTELMRAVAERIAACPCQEGCPSCVGPAAPGGPPAKEPAVMLLGLGLRPGLRPQSATAGGRPRPEDPDGHRAPPTPCTAAPLATSGEAPGAARAAQFGAPPTQLPVPAAVPSLPPSPALPPVPWTPAR